MKTFLKFLSFLFVAVLFLGLVTSIYFFTEKSWLNIALTVLVGSVFVRSTNAFQEKVETILDDKK